MALAPQSYVALNQKDLLIQLQTKTLLLKLALATVHGLAAFGRALRFVFLVLLFRPLITVWEVMLLPVATRIYQVYFTLSNRFKKVFFFQHKVLGIFTSRYLIQVGVVLVTVVVTSTNLVQAKEVTVEEFGRKSLFTQVFSPDEEVVITKDSIRPKQKTYVDQQAVLTNSTPQLAAVTETPEAADVDTSLNDGALVASTILNNSAMFGLSDNIQKYTVQEGDTLSTIAAQFDITTQTILWSNNLASTSTIRPGQELYILPVTGVAHTVQSGETLASIAQKFGGNVDDIVAFNGLVDASAITAGTELIIPDGEQPAPPPVVKLASVGSIFSSTPAVNAVPSGTKLQWPTTTRKISQYFGAYHTGVDIDGACGDPVWAAESGRVVSAGWYGGYGNQVVIDHGNGLRTRYGHMTSINVSNGQTVSRGQYLGSEGTTGRSTGCHIHFETMVNGRFVNPFSYF